MKIQKIIIGADVALINGFKNFHIRKNFSSELQNYISKADFRIYDLELPITEVGKPIHKTGPNLRMDISEVRGLEQLKPDLLVTANNHIMDYGTVGLDSTLQILERANIQNIGSGFGGGIRKEYSFLINQMKISIYTCAEKEFVEENGISYVNTFSEKVINDIIYLKSQCDYVIVLYHGGIEHYPFPGKYLVERCHALADSGADLVLCQHNHIIGVREKYHDVEILYGQGNFVADYDYSNVEYGFLAELRVGGSKDINIEYKPIKKEGGKVSFPDNDETSKILQNFVVRSNMNFDLEYRKYVTNEIYKRLQSCCAMPSILRKIDNHTNHFFVKYKYGKKSLLLLQNIIRCDVHRNILIDGIGELLKVK